MQASRSIQQMTEGLNALDLGPIKFKLMDPREGQGWTREFVDRMETEYKRFLTLLVKYPEEAIAPTKDVDKFWHAHILDTQKYMEDCDRIFGFYLHHFPYFGMRGVEDAAALDDAGKRTQELYAVEFGAHPQAAMRSWCSAAVDLKSGQPAWCSAAVELKSGEPAWCSAAVDLKSSQPAWCSAAVEMKSGRPAWCSASRRVDTTTRPSLPAT